MSSPFLSCPMLFVQALPGGKNFWYNMENQSYFPTSTSFKIRLEIILVSRSKIQFGNQFENFLNVFYIL